MTRKWKQLLEDIIIGKLVATLTDEGFSTEFSYSNGSLWCYAWSADEKPPETFEHWVRLSQGNGAEIITDYTTNLEEYIKNINEFAKSWMD